MKDSLHQRLEGATVRIALPEPTSTDPAYNQRAWAPYFHSLASSGAIGVPIPLDGSAETIRRLVDSCSGVLLPGSPADIDPQIYGARRAAQCAPSDSSRERVDSWLLEGAFRAKKPVLGICYGLQSLNTWLGGTLVQHLPLITSVAHDAGPEVLSAHSVRVVSGSRLASAIGFADDLVSITEAEATVVNSSHHQSVDRPGEGVGVVARCSEDGVIEAIEGGDGSFVVAVQWHPERIFDVSAASRHLFRAFVNAASVDEQGTQAKAESFGL